MVTEFPEVLKADDQNRPHCEDGPSHRWRDGWALYHWHGVRVTRGIIENPAGITVGNVRSEQNQEVRRVMIERMGWERFCQGAQMRILSADSLNANFPSLPVSELVALNQRLVVRYRSGTEQAELLEAAEFKDFEGRALRFVRVTDPSTDRQYVIRVSHDCPTPYSGIGASFGMTEDQYKSKVYRRHGDVLLQPIRLESGKSFHS